MKTQQSHIYFKDAYLQNAIHNLWVVYVEGVVAAITKPFSLTHKGDTQPSSWKFQSHSDFSKMAVLPRHMNIRYGELELHTSF